MSLPPYPNQLYGSVIVNGVEYTDNKIHDLHDISIEGWSFASDQSMEESCIVAEDDAGQTICFVDLRELLTYLES